jgi:hypothetical protein
MTQWQFYPKSDSIPAHLEAVIEAFRSHESDITSAKHELPSNSVLRVIRTTLQAAGYTVETSKRAEDRIKVPVLFGRNGGLEKYFDADGVNTTTKTVLEVEAGRGVVNNDFLKHLFQACMMHDVDYFVVAVRLLYQKRNDFEVAYRFFDTLYASRRLELPLRGVLLLGY